MKEDKLHHLFEKLRKEAPETSPEQVAEWLTLLPNPVAPPTIPSDIISNTLLTSKNMIIMSIIISVIASAIIFLNPGKSTEIPHSPEIPLTKKIELPEETLSPSELSIESTPEEFPILQEERNEPITLIKEKSTPEEMSRLQALDYSIINTTPVLKLSSLMPAEVETPGSSSDPLKIDTLFTNIRTVELKCSTCKNVRFVSHQKEGLRFQGNISTEEKNKENQPRFEFETVGSTLIITFQTNNKKINFSGSTPKLSVDILIEMPREVNVKSNISYGNVEINGLENDFCQVKSSSGNISISNTASNFDISSSYGHQTYQNIIGPIRTKSSSGNIQMDRIKGNIHISNTYGKINLSNIVGSLNASGSSSTITVHTISGNMELKSTYGHIKVEKAVGNLSAKASSGNITVDLLKGDLETNNTYGKQDFSNISGSINSKGSSSSFKINTVAGNIDLTTTYGNVLLENTLGHVNIVGSNGNVEGINVDLRDKMNITLTYGNIKMRLKNKQEELSYNLSSSSGNIKILPLNLQRKKHISHGVGPIQIKTSTSSGHQVFE